VHSLFLLGTSTEKRSTASSSRISSRAVTPSTRDATEARDTMASTTCAIAGERGSGKTTLVNALIRQALRLDSLGDDEEEEDDDDAVEEVRSSALSRSNTF
jgi:predicted ATPase